MPTDTTRLQECHAVLQALVGTPAQRLMVMPKSTENKFTIPVASGLSLAPLRSKKVAAEE